MEILQWQEGWQLWDLVSYLTANKILVSGNIFRGQTNSDWGLVPGLYRRDVNIFSSTAHKSERYIFAENEMIEGFFDRAALLLPNYPRSPLVDRIIAQHYGVPTQLLDWTLDPFIALYFAVNGGNPQTDCALFYIKPLQRLGNHWPRAEFPWRGRIAKVIPPVIDDRIRVQKSIFTIHNYGDAEDFTPLNERELKISAKDDSSHPKDEVEHLGKITIPSRLRKQILLQLIEMGVDSSLVYPGLQGIGQRIFDIAEISSYGGMTVY